MVPDSPSVAFTALSLDSGSELAGALVGLQVLSVGPAVRPEELGAAVTLRDALRRAMAAAGAGGRLAPRDVETINSYAADEPPIVALSPQGALLHVATDPVRCALSAIARDGIGIIALRARDLRCCDGCGTYFIDDSRGRRRRWCSMDRCGNRAKVASYRARRKR